MVTAALEFQKAGQTNLATEGTYKVLQKAGFTNIEKTSLDREDLDNISDYIDRNEVVSIINTTGPRKRSVDAKHIRRVSLMRNKPLFHYCGMEPEYRAFYCHNRFWEKVQL